MTHYPFFKRSDGRISPGLILVIVIAVAVPAMALAGLHKWRSLRNVQPKFQSQPVAVVAQQAKAQELPMFIEAVGSLRAVREVVLAPEVNGRVTEILFKAGSSVAKNDLLVQLYDAPLRAERKEAQAKVHFAEAQLKRSKNLAPSGAEARSILDQRRSERDQAVAALQRIDAELKQKNILAPFAGELGIRRINPGQYLNPGDPIATLTALDSLYIDFTIPQQELSNIQPGAVVDVAVDAWPDQVFTAHVNVVEPHIAEDTRNITVQALLSNKDRKLRPGMYATVRLQQPPQKEALLVPITAVMTTAFGNSMMLIRGESPVASGKAEAVPVTTGRQIGNKITIARGLEPGDVFIAEGQVKVRPGAEVKVARLMESGK